MCISIQLPWGLKPSDTAFVNHKQLKAGWGPELLGSAKMAEPLSMYIAKLWALTFFLAQLGCLQTVRHLSSQLGIADQFLDFHVQIPSTLYFAYKCFLDLSLSSSKDTKEWFGISHLLSKVIYSKEKRERTVNIICSGFTFLFIGGLELKRNPVGD